MLKQNSFLGNSFIYIVGVALNQGINFLLLVIFLPSVLSPDDYALVALYSLWVNVCLSFISLQSASSVNNALVEHGESKLNSYLFSISLLSVFASIITILIVLIFNNSIESIIGFPTFFVILIIVQAGISSFAALQLEKNRVLKKAFPAVAWSSSIPVLRICLSVALVLFVFKSNYLGDIYGFSIAAILIGLVAFAKTAYDAKLKFNFNYIKFALPITVPIIFHSISNLILTGTDKVMLYQMLGRSEMGIYSFIFNISILPTGLWFAINNSWSVEYFEKLINNDIDSIKTLTNTYIKFIFCVYVLVLLVLPEVIYIIAPPEYFSGVTYASFIMAGGFFTFLYTICSVHQIYAKKTIYIPTATVISAVLNIGLNLLFIPRYGAFGAAISSVISFFILFMMHYIFSKFVIGGFPIEFKRLVIPGALVACLSLFVNLLIDFMITRLLLATVFGVFFMFSFVRYLRKSNG